ncbi:zf-HC2 domain-containing protein [Romboutsia lituseburensis]|uniref:Putative zinc-finger n=1 Tax=Romboutsia lituseburensis DSM 797 TaxID=1121325 RepID=A0A1G9TDP1_9FIRM|nr:zf-HC2 domain-containing protein [Romboutsia lituseburensis]CEH36241.1 Putative zinc-finger [Romboutsia lituseburensis]SDM45767.1 Putative zinc-finger [Romboutsia lituseburensis DSM 797]
MKCEIIKDLLPSYIDNLTSDESNKEIENHIITCSKCKSELDNMNQDINIETLEINKKDIKPLKKFDKKYRNVFRNISICSLIIYLIALYYTQYSFNDVYDTRARLAIDLQTISENHDIKNSNSYSTELQKLLNQNYKNVLSLEIYTTDYKNTLYTYKNKSNADTDIISTHITGDVFNKKKKNIATFYVGIDYKPVIMGNAILKYSALIGWISLITYIILLLKSKFVSKF